jgi:hypothetical protein
MFRLVRKLVASRWTSVEIYRLLSHAPRHQIAYAITRAVFLA